MATFQLRNNSTRSYGFGAGLCIAGCGNPTPPEAAKQVIDGKPFSLPPLYELTEAQMFKSYRGVIAAMQTGTPTGKQAVEVLVNGVPKGLTSADLEAWAAEYRAKMGWAEPKTAADHAREAERSMARPEDPLEVQLRKAQEERDARLVETIVRVMEQRAATSDPGNVAKRGRP